MTQRSLNSAQLLAGNRASLALESCVGPAVQAAVVPVGKVGHQAAESFAAAPQTAPYPGQQARHGIEASIAVDHLLHALHLRQVA